MTITHIFLTQNPQNSQKPAGSLFSVALRFPWFCVLTSLKCFAFDVVNLRFLRAYAHHVFS